MANKDYQVSLDSQLRLILCAPLVPKQAFTPWTNVGFCGAYVHRSGAKPA